MTHETKAALARFADLVALAIARLENSKDVDWRAVVDAQEKLEKALENEP